MDDISTQAMHHSAWIDPDFLRMKRVVGLQASCMDVCLQQVDACHANMVATGERALLGNDDTAQTSAIQGAGATTGAPISCAPSTSARTTKRSGPTSDRLSLTKRPFMQTTSTAIAERSSSDSQPRP